MYSQFMKHYKKTRRSINHSIMVCANNQNNLYKEIRIHTMFGVISVQNAGGVDEIFQVIKINNKNIDI